MAEPKVLESHPEDGQEDWGVNQSFYSFKMPLGDEEEEVRNTSPKQPLEKSFPRLTDPPSRKNHNWVKKLLRLSSNTSKAIRKKSPTAVKGPRDKRRSTPSSRRIQDKFERMSIREQRKIDASIESIFTCIKSDLVVNDIHYQGVPGLMDNKPNPMCPQRCLHNLGVSLSGPTESNVDVSS
jgi:hypothetical protein